MSAPYWLTDPSRPVPSCAECHGTGGETLSRTAPCPRCFGSRLEPTYPPSSRQLAAFRRWLAAHPEGPAPTHRRPYPEWMDGPRWADALRGGAYLRSTAVRRELRRGTPGYAEGYGLSTVERAFGSPIGWRRP